VKVKKGVIKPLKHTRILTKFTQPFRLNRELGGVSLKDVDVSERTAPKRQMIDESYPGRHLERSGRDLAEVSFQTVLEVTEEEKEYKLF